MATFIEIANDLAKHFLTSQNRQQAVIYIINEINGLVYSTSNEQLSYSDKKLIVRYIGEFISGQRPLQYRYGGRVIITEQKDNTQFVGMVDYILAQLNTGKK